MTLAEQLIPRLQERFPDRGLKVTGTSQPCAIFPAIHPEVGDISIHDDGHELTLVAGHFTHGHFSNYDDIPDSQKYHLIIERVLDFLDDVFADRVVFWGAHKQSGGWYQRDSDVDGGTQSTFLIDGGDSPERTKEYVWSGPLYTPRKRLGSVQRMVNFLRGRRP